MLKTVVVSLVLLSQTVLADFGTTSSTTNSTETSEKRPRRAAIGLMTGGISGRFGADLALYFTEDVGVFGGVGTSTDFNSAFLGAKFTVIDSFVSSYLSGGYAQWMGKGGRRAVGKTTPGFFAKRFLNEKERNTGQFHENILFVGAGLQYTVDSGDWSGFSVYLEALMVADVDDLVSAPTLGLGAKYFF